MACIILKGPNGERRVTEGKPYRKLHGEVIAGVDWDCSPEAIDDLTHWVTSEGLMIGNVIKSVTATLGIEQCEPCRGRQRRYNEVGIELQKKIKNVFIRE